MSTTDRPLDSVESALARQEGPLAALESTLPSRLPPDLRSRLRDVYDACQLAVSLGTMSQEDMVRTVMELNTDYQGLQRRRERDRVERLWQQEQADKVEVRLDYDTAATVWTTNPDPDPIVENLLPLHGSLLVNAQRKAGKTTLAFNLIEALTTGKPFLGRLATKRVSKVAYLNYEMSKGLFTLYSQNLLTNPDDAVIVTMNTTGNLLASEKGRAMLAERFIADGVKVLIVDPLSSAFSGESLNDNDETRAWLDELLLWALGTCQMEGLVVIHHSGWNGDRSRGASAIEDWAMVVAGLRTKEGQQNGPRFFDAFGRLGVLPQDELSFDSNTGVLSLTNKGGRKTASMRTRTDDLLTPATEWLREQPGNISQRQLVAALREQGCSVSNEIQGKLIQQLVASAVIEPVGKGYRYCLADKTPEQEVLS